MSFFPCGSQLAKVICLDELSKQLQKDDLTITSIKQHCRFAINKISLLPSLCIQHVWHRSQWEGKKERPNSMLSSLRCRLPFREKCRYISLPLQIPFKGPCVSVCICYILMHWALRKKAARYASYTFFFQALWSIKLIKSWNYSIKWTNLIKAIFDFLPSCSGKIKLSNDLNIWQNNNMEVNFPHNHSSNLEWQQKI